MWFQVVVTFVRMIPVFYFSAYQECEYYLTAFVAVINKWLPIEWCAISATWVVILYNIVVQVN
jgi:hypothetical protein